MRGFRAIDGHAEHLGPAAAWRKARAKGAYRDLFRADPDGVLDTGGRQYRAIVAVGAIGAGAAPAEYIDRALAHLEPGGLFVVSLNDHTLEDLDSTEARLTRAVTGGTVEKDHGRRRPASARRSGSARVSGSCAGSRCPAVRFFPGATWKAWKFRGRLMIPGKGRDDWFSSSATHDKVIVQSQKEKTGTLI
ncbi:MAG: hypothetical protein U5K36_04910 [Roseovarius sp.]|nr:hypothetical protein [Roseovarius sp.]